MTTARPRIAFKETIRHAARHHDRRGVGDIAWLVVEHLVTGIQKSPQCEIDRLGDADGDEDFGERLVGNLEMTTHIVGDRAAKTGQAEIRSVAGATALEGENRRLADMPWGCEIGFSDAERNDIVH